MPKSKRAKLVSLTKTHSAGKENKEKLIENIHKCADEYQHLFVFTLHNMRSTQLKEIRKMWESGRFFFGKNKVMQFALGREMESEYKENLFLVSQCITGNCGLFFTNEPIDQVIKFFKTYQEKDYARSGFVATETVQLPEGPTTFSHSLEPYLRNQLKMPTQLKSGVVSLYKDFTVCKEGEELTPETAKILELLEIKMSSFYLNLVCLWSQGKFKQF